MQDNERNDGLIELGAVSEETRGVGDTAWEDREPLYFSVEAA